MSTGHRWASDTTIGRLRERCRDDKGFVVVFFALSLIVLMGIAALVVDLGYWYLQGQRIQRAADAAAEAGVVYVPGDVHCSQPTVCADTVAANVAADNGFTSGVSVNWNSNEPHDLSVTIKNPSVPAFFARVFGFTSISDTRTGVAQYQQPIPLGSPENSFGTGTGPSNTGGGSTTGPGATPATGLWAAVNGYCTAQENGDQYLSAFDGLWTGNSWVCPANSASMAAPQYPNDEYNGGAPLEPGYSYDITTPKDAGGFTTSDIEVDVYDPAYEPSGCSGSPDEAIGSTGSNGTASTITTIYSLFTHPVPGDPTQDVQMGSSVPEATAAAGTCAQWVKMFDIPAGSADGEYRLQVTTLAGQSDSSGINAYGVRVWSTGSGPTWTQCSTLSTVAWYSPTCPEISGESALSVWISNHSGNHVAQFYLASIDAAYAGHTMELDLFDPGEGSHYMQILDPSGCPMPFSLVATDNTSRTAEGFPNIPPTDDTSDASLGAEPAGCSQPTGSPPDPGLDVSGSLAHNPTGIDDNYTYNDRHLQLSVTIPATYTAPNGGWWQIKYTADGSVSDRTTWSVQLLGDPVHLIQ